MTGCDWVAIRNLAITLGVFTAFATSSAIFAFHWDRWAPDGPWKKIITSISFSAAATWALLGFGILVILMSSTSSFCACASTIRACAIACTGLTIALRAMLAALLGLAAACTVASFDDELLQNPLFLGGLGAAIGASLIGMISIGTFAAQIASCQP